MGILKKNENAIKNLEEKKSFSNVYVERQGNDGTNAIQF